MANDTQWDRNLLRNLPLPIRLTLAMFLIAAGVGYLTGLIQLHFAHASPGNLLPTPNDAVKVYAGEQGPKMTLLERVLEAPASMPFNGNGSMRKAFLEKSDDFKEAIKQKPEATVRAEREGERLALLEWIRAGANRKEYDEDSYPLSEKLAKQPITIDFLKVDDKGKELTPRMLSIKTLIDNRCVRCHSTGGEADKFSFEKFENFIKYNREPSSGAMSLERLASITHTHMMAFAVLFGATGVLFSFTSYPAKIRAIFGTWTLFFQVMEIICWWLSRLDPRFAEFGVAGCGALVGFGLAVQILGGLFDLFHSKGRAMLCVLLLAAIGLGGLAWVKQIQPYLDEKSKPAVEQKETGADKAP
jgi:hypothetical protein